MGVGVDLDRGAVGVCAGWPNGNVAQQTQTVASTTGTRVQPRTGCVLYTQNTHTHTNISSINQNVKSTENVVMHVVYTYIQYRKIILNH